MSFDNTTLGPSVFIVDKEYIKPETRKAGGMSWALMRNPDGLDCDVFATHCWQEGIFEFIIKVKAAWPKEAKRGLWCCFLAIPQNSDISGVLGINPNDSPFAVALTQATHMVVVPNHKTSIYSRLWCVFEAYVAMNELKGRDDLQIHMPLSVIQGSFAWRVVPGLIFPAVGVSLGVWVLGPLIGFALGPVMWLLCVYLFCQLLARLANCRISRKKSAHRDHCLSMIRVCYFELFVVGIGSGLAWWHLFDVECGEHMKFFQRLCMPAVSNTTVRSVLFGVEHLGFRFEEGEELSVMLLLVGLVFVYVWHIERLLVRKCVELEGALLDFRTVSEADCSNPRDTRLIMGEIEQDVARIDRMIKMLKMIGRYNSVVKYNVELGVPWELCRDGIDYSKLTAAVITWEFWWITDIAGRDLYYVAIALPAATVAMLSALAYFVIGEKCVHFISTGLVFGVLFVIISNHHLFFTHLAVTSLSMSGSTVWLQLVMFAVLLLVNAWTYLGWRQAAPNWLADVLSNLFVCASCEDLTSDEEAYRIVHAAQYDSRSSAGSEEDS